MPVKQKRYVVDLDRNDYNILKNNSMITICCGNFLKKAKIKDDKVELLLTKYEISELTGFLATEANHSKSKKEEQELSKIFELLEMKLYSLNQVQ